MEKDVSIKLIDLNAWQALKEPDRKKLEKEVSDYNSNLEKIAKSKEELIIKVEKRVKAIEFYGTANVTFTPFSERVFGGRSPIYEVGDTYSCKIEFQTTSDVKEVRFIGWPNIQAGDTIRAYILAGEQKGRRYLQNRAGGLCICEYSGEETENIPFDAFGLKEGASNRLWVPRKLNECEEALKIEKLKDYTAVLASWISKSR